MLARRDDDDDRLDVKGLRLSVATLATLANVDIAALSHPFPPTFFASPKTPKLFQQRFSQLVTAPFTGYPKLFKESHVSEPPLQLFEATTEWLEARFGEKSLKDAPTPAIPPAVLSTTDWEESRVDFKDGLRGVLTMPTRPRGRQAIIICTAAGTPRSGDGNFGSRTCRAVASAGVPALRFDFHGYGESADPPAGRLHVYETDRGGELRAAAEVLRARGFDDIVAVGLCTGGYHAIRGVVGDTGIHHAIAINTYLVWRPGAELDFAAHASSLRSVYLRAPVKARSWVRSLKVGLRAAFAPKFLLLKRTFFPDAATRAARADIKAALERGARIRLLFGSSDRSLEALADFGPRGSWLARLPGISIAFDPNLDHSLYLAQSQDIAIHEIFAFLGLEALSLSRDTRGSAAAAALSANDPETLERCCSTDFPPENARS